MGGQLCPINHLTEPLLHGLVAQNSNTLLLVMWLCDRETYMYVTPKLLIFHPWLHYLGAWLSLCGCGLVGGGYLLSLVRFEWQLIHLVTYVYSHLSEDCIPCHNMNQFSFELLKYPLQPTKSHPTKTKPHPQTTKPAERQRKYLFT